MAITVAVPIEFVWVLLVACVLAFELLIIGFVAGGSRRKIFTPEFMKQFEEEHKAAFPG